MRTLVLKDDNWDQWKFGDTNAIMTFDAETDSSVPDYADSVMTFHIADATSSPSKPGDYQATAPGHVDDTGKLVQLHTADITGLKPGTYVVELWLTDKKTQEVSIYPSQGFVFFTVDENTMGVSDITNISSQTLQAVYAALVQQIKAFKTGIPGKDGLTPKLKTGTVTKLAPDATPTYLLTADPSDKTGATYIIDLGIPQGYKGDTGATGKSAYDIWIDAGNAGTQQDFLKAIRGPQGLPGTAGEDGKDGADGKDGITPHIGANGNWFNGDIDTGKPSRGMAGKTPVKGTDYWTDADKQAIQNEDKQYIENTLSKINLEPEAFENEAALKAKYPSGASGLMVTVDTGHKWLWIDGDWKDCGVYQSAGIADHSITADKLSSSILTGEALMAGVNLGSGLNDQAVGYGYSADSKNTSSALMVANQCHYKISQATGSTAYTSWNFQRYTVTSTDNLVLSFKYKSTLRITIDYALIKSDGSADAKSISLQNDVSGVEKTYTQEIDMSGYTGLQLRDARSTFGAAEGSIELYDFSLITAQAEAQKKAVARMVADQQTSYLMLNFDDATNMYKQRYGLLKSYGFNFSFCLNEGFYDNKGFQDGEKALFDQMIADGNDVALYGGVGTRPDIHSCTADQWTAYVKPLVDFCASNGIYNITCYHSPNNLMSVNGAQGLKQLGFKMARYAVSPDKSLITGFDQSSFRVPTLEIQDSNLDDIKSKIDEAIDEGASLSIFTHLVQTSATNEWNTSLSVYKQMLDYIKQKVDSDQIKVVTWREFYAAKLPHEGHENDYQRIVKMLSK